MRAATVDCLTRPLTVIDSHALSSTLINFGLVQILMRTFATRGRRGNYPVNLDARSNVDKSCERVEKAHANSRLHILV
jgi:hypothetical protein